MRKELGDEQIRVTVRLPQALYDELVGPGRQYRHTGSRSVSDMCRRAIVHYLQCPDLQRTEAEAREAYEQREAISQATIAAWLAE
jgi:hypothetical protein